MYTYTIERVKVLNWEWRNDPERYFISILVIIWVMLFALFFNMHTNTQLIIQSWCPRLIIILWVILDTYEKRRLYITVKLCTILAKSKVTNSKTNPQNLKEFNFYVVDLIHYTELSSRCFQVTNTTPCAYPWKDIDYFRFPSEIPWNKFQANWIERSATIVIIHTHSFIYCTHSFESTLNSQHFVVLGQCTA